MSHIDTKQMLGRIFVYVFLKRRKTKRLSADISEYWILQKPSYQNLYDVSDLVVKGNSGPD